MVRPQDHMIHPTLTVRTDTSGSRTTYDVYHRTKENAKRATWHQRQLHQRIRENRNNAASAIINAVSVNPNIHYIDILGNKFPAATELAIEYYFLRNELFLQNDLASLPHQVWCLILGRLQPKRSSSSVIFSFLIENPSFIR